MIPSEVSASLLLGLVSTGGAWWWVKTHTHPELVARVELKALEELIRAQHTALVRELDQLRELVTRNQSRR